MIETKRGFLAPGSTLVSILSLTVATLGAGTSTLPAVTQATGYVVGCLLIAFGALISIYSGMLLVSCADKSNSDSYEKIAAFAFNQRWKLIVSWSMIICLCGTLISYITLIKSLTPHILSVLIYGGAIPPDTDLPFLLSPGFTT